MKSRGCGCDECSGIESVLQELDRTTSVRITAREREVMQSLAE